MLLRPSHLVLVELRLLNVVIIVNVSDNHEFVEFTPYLLVWMRLDALLGHFEGLADCLRLAE